MLTESKVEKMADDFFKLVGIGVGALILFIGVGVPLLWAFSGVVD